MLPDVTKIWGKKNLKRMTISTFLKNVVVPRKNVFYENKIKKHYLSNNPLIHLV